MATVKKITKPVDGVTYEVLVGYAEKDGKGNVIADTYATQTELDGKQDTLSTAQLAAVNSGVTSTTVAQVNTNRTSINTLSTGKQDNLTTAQLAAANSGVTSAKVSNYDSMYSQLDNLATQDYVNEQIAAQIHMSVEVVTALPTTGESGVIYLVANSGSGTNVYDEYLWVASTSTFEKIGSTETDLSNYVTLNTAQTISGSKTFDSSVIIGTNGVLNVQSAIVNTNGGTITVQGDFDLLASNSTGTFNIKQTTGAGVNFDVSLLQYGGAEVATATDLADYVTIAGNQTITGTKTFSGTVTVGTISALNSGTDINFSTTGSNVTWNNKTLATVDDVSDAGLTFTDVEI